jgi:hypothetical protein
MLIDEWVNCNYEICTLMGIYCLDHQILLHMQTYIVYSLHCYYEVQIWLKIEYNFYHFSSPACVICESMHALAYSIVSVISKLLIRITVSYLNTCQYQERKWGPRFYEWCWRN